MRSRPYRTPKISDWATCSEYSRQRISRKRKPKFAKLSVFITKSTTVLRSFWLQISFSVFLSYGMQSSSSKRRFILWISVAMCV